MRVGVLEALAKANLAACSLSVASPVATKAFETGMDALQDHWLGPLAALSDREAGKRSRNAAGKVLRSARLPELLRAPSVGAPLTFNAGEMALIRFFSGVDRYVFCAQNALFAPEVSLCGTLVRPARAA